MIAIQNVVRRGKSRRYPDMEDGFAGASSPVVAVLNRCPGCLICIHPRTRAPQTLPSGGAPGSEGMEEEDGGEPRSLTCLRVYLFARPALLPHLRRRVASSRSHDRSFISRYTSAEYSLSFLIPRDPIPSRRGPPPQPLYPVSLVCIACGPRPFRLRKVYFTRRREVILSNRPCPAVRSALLMAFVVVVVAAAAATVTARSASRRRFSRGVTAHLRAKRRLGPRGIASTGCRGGKGEGGEE